MKKSYLLILLLCLILLTGCGSEKSSAKKLMKVIEKDGFTCQDNVGNESFDCTRNKKDKEETIIIDYNKGNFVSSYKYKDEKMNIRNVGSWLYSYPEVGTILNGRYPINTIYKENGKYDYECFYLPEDDDKEIKKLKIGKNVVESNILEGEERVCSEETEQKINKMFRNLEEYYNTAKLDITSR